MNKTGGVGPKQLRVVQKFNGLRLFNALRAVQKFNGVTTTVNLNQETSTIPRHNGGHHPLSMTKA